MKCPSCGRLDFENSETCPRCGEAMPAGSGERSSASMERNQPGKIAVKDKTPAPGPLFTAPSTLEQPDSANLIRAEEPPPPLDDEPPIKPVSEKLSKSAVETPPPTRVESKRRGSSDSHHRMVTSDSHKPLTETLPPPKRTPTEPPSSYPAMVTSDGRLGAESADIYRSDSSERLRRGSVERSGEPSSERAPLKSDERSASGSSLSTERKTTATPPPQRYKNTDTYPPREYVDKIRARSAPQPKDAPKITPSPYVSENATFSSELSTDWIEKYARSHVASDADRAGISVRVWAFAIDWLLLITLGVILLLTGRLVVSLLGSSNYSPGKLLAVLSLPVGLVWIVIVLIYFTFFTAASGQTPGKLVMDLRVVGPDGQPPDLQLSALRAVIYTAGVLAFGAGLWWIYIDKRKRPLHDLLTRTTVMTVFMQK